MKSLIVLIILVASSKFAYPTGQVPDYLVIDSDTFAIFSNPLESYFEEENNREISGLRGCGSTACWRGYKAFWLLSNDSLFLTKITSCHSFDWCKDIRDADLGIMFGNEYNSKTVFASWFTGGILIPKGNLIQYVHMGYGSIYEEEETIIFKRGTEIKRKIKSNKRIAEKIENNNKIFEITKEVQDTLFYYVEKNVNWDTVATPWYMLCDEEYIITYNRKGKLRKVWVNWESETFLEKIDGYWLNMTYERRCRITIKRALKSLSLSYLDLPKGRFQIYFYFVYNRNKGILELRKAPWFE